ncbi:hypothetical protein JKY79_01615 [Candidatus Babeliales bacterium]|nr:hypothetical protein [Candidatus Babeliales bacterium]
MAINKNKPEIVRLLIGLKANIYCQADFAKASNSGFLMNVLGNMITGSHSEIEDDLRGSPLHYAIKNQNLTIMKIILQSYSNMDITEAPYNSSQLKSLIESNFQDNDKKKVAFLLLNHWGNLESLFEKKNNLDKNDATIIYQMTIEDPEEQAGCLITKLGELNPDKAEEYKETLSKHPSLASSSWLTYVAIGAIIYDFATFKTPKEDLDLVDSIDIKKEKTMKKTSGLHRLDAHRKAYYKDLKQNFLKNHKKLIISVVYLMTYLL